MTSGFDSPRLRCASRPSLRLRRKEGEEIYPSVRRGRWFVDGKWKRWVGCHAEVLEVCAVGASTSSA